MYKWNPDVALDLIERILAKLDKDTSQQVEIETKFLEVQEGADGAPVLEHLGSATST